MEQSKRTVQQRIQDMKAVINDLKIEGFEFTKEESNELHHIALGYKTTEQARKEVFAEIERLKTTNPEKFYQGVDKK
jgi:hypothetical protein